MAIGTPGGTPERPALFFADAEEWSAWLGANHASASELWMGMFKKHVSQRGLLWEDAVVQALRWGWIDSVVQRIDADAVRQRWTPRKSTSTWSLINIAAAQRLIEQGLMEPSGLAAFQARRPDRQGIYAYEQASLEWSAEHEDALAANPSAARFWAMATASYRKGAIHWVTSAKRAQTRQQRLASLVSDCAAGRLIPSQRYGAEPAWVGRARAELGLSPD